MAAAAARDQMAALAAGGQRGAEAGPEARLEARSRPRPGGSARGWGRAGRAAACRRISAPGRCSPAVPGVLPGGGSAAQKEIWKGEGRGGERGKIGKNLEMTKPRLPWEGRGGAGWRAGVLLFAVSALNCLPFTLISVIKGHLHERL